VKDGSKIIGKKLTTNVSHFPEQEIDGLFVWIEIVRCPGALGVIARGRII
jgi:hypothetical protein